MILLYAALSMMAKDLCATLLTIAEARGKSSAAGALDAAGDLATILVTLFGAGQIIVHGWDARSIETLGTIMLVSFIGTNLWTRLGTRLMPDV